MTNKDLIYKKLNEIFTTIDEKYYSEDFHFIENYLLEFDIDNSELEVSIGVLSVTNRFKKLLKNRSQFLDKLELKLTKEIGEERTINILYGLR